MIDGIGRSHLPPMAAAETGRTGAPAGPDRASGPAPARTNDSAPAEIGGLARALASAPPVDTARVEALKTAIASGSYRIDPDAIAGAMIALEGRR